MRNKEMEQRIANRLIGLWALGILWVPFGALLESFFREGSPASWIFLLLGLAISASLLGALFRVTRSDA